ncbi:MULTISPECIES: DNA polymerase III subunit gamma/tau [Ensifer]|jgi:DNA polymerase III subunit gamma/tau|uniref:DNA polymerase III subunit gamma/tau n=1 Tax=Ensifer canadensis TaxID=555315 RepID=A0AAW4FJJ2_9HYPH|nr:MULTISPECIES: DNA polymerase III subunit gamma/tau [Ensifer]AHK43016.1 DNA polymerase III, subunits gamma and tau [Ensifer adhaerens OV14]MDP9628893.1 DNA polymerase-3 subunit gamma/tau [Ensifer adhaerens]KQW63252.1 DNA polymerase III subunit gamma/tau [Ensifer sp. Root1252]KQW85267.1 DNA polymerase III subunit gamma/tau [Ensifer sp. Root127]KQY75660.1 DNA polymerase III subunit gamma/tau [Ensifer sp. Root142]
MSDETSISSEQKPAAYRVLARKYRPKDFSDLMVGQEPMVRTLTNAFETGRIAQAYMLTGVRGVGKTTTARILARALNYKTPEIDRPTIDLRALGEHCQAIMDGRHVDVIEMDAASHTGIDDIREIIEQVRYRPVSARYKVYIIDEVHMLSTQAFNGLLKTLEEPPEHVKFIFATTEIRKVPITVLSRCQRFDLRRISGSDLVGLFSTILGKEGVSFDPEALAMVARAAEGSARDGLSLLDQAIAHGGGSVEVETVRSMLGLADRARIVDLFEHIVRGDVAAALAEFSAQYEAGANPTVVLTDLADFTHLVTRLKYVPDAASDQSLSEIERTRGAEFAGNVAVSTLSRIWQMLLKGIPEAESSSRPAGAAEMVLIRLAHAAHLPSPEDAARRVLELSGSDNGSVRPAPGGGSGGGMLASVGAPVQAQAAQSTSMGRPTGNGATMLRAVPDVSPQPISVGHTEERPAAAPSAKAQPSVPVNSVSDIADLCAKNKDIKLKTLVRGFVRLVRIEPGRLDVNVPDDAPKTLLGELAVKLKEWTGIHWIVSYSRDPGEPTMIEAEQQAQEKRVSDARQDPDVAAILARFPGAKITDVRIRAVEEEEAESVAPATAESADGDIVPGDDIE